MSQTFETGQMVMVREKYGSRDNPYWAKKMVVRPNVVEIGSRSYTRPTKWETFDPENSYHKGKKQYVEVSDQPREINCWSCNEDGMTEETVKEFFDYDSGSFEPEHKILVTCSICNGSKKIMNDPYKEHYLNAKNYVLDIETYESTIGKAKAETEARKKEAEFHRDNVVRNLIRDIVNLALNSDNPELEVAKLIQKHSYAHFSNPKNYNGYVVQSNIYQAAGFTIKSFEEKKESVNVT